MALMYKFIEEHKKAQRSSVGWFFFSFLQTMKPPWGVFVERGGGARSGVGWEWEGQEVKVMRQMN